MFPNAEIDTLDTANTTTSRKYNIISNGEAIRQTPDFDFENSQILLKDGNVGLTSDYRNVRNWIIKFLLTPIDIYKIYEGTGFGTSCHKLKGYKNIDGVLYAQIRKEIEEGFLLNPNIKSVLDVDLVREKNILCVYVKVQLADGYILENKTETYNLKV